MTTYLKTRIAMGVEIFETQAQYERMEKALEQTRLHDIKLRNEYDRGEISGVEFLTRLGYGN